MQCGQAARQERYATEGRQGWPGEVQAEVRMDGLGCCFWSCCRFWKRGRGDARQRGVGGISEAGAGLTKPTQSSALAGTTEMDRTGNNERVKVKQQARWAGCWIRHGADACYSMTCALTSLLPALPCPPCAAHRHTDVGCRMTGGHVTGAEDSG